MQHLCFLTRLATFFFICLSASFAGQATSTSSQMIKVQWNEIGGLKGELFNISSSGIFIESAPCSDSNSCALLRLTASPFSNSGHINFKLTYSDQLCGLHDISVPFTVQNGVIETPLTSYSVNFYCNGSVQAPMLLTVSGNSTSGYIMTYS